MHKDICAKREHYWKETNTCGLIYYLAHWDISIRYEQISEEEPLWIKFVRTHQIEDINLDYNHCPFHLEQLLYSPLEQCQKGITSTNIKESEK